jgi:TonB-dependent receptor
MTLKKIFFNFYTLILILITSQFSQAQNGQIIGKIIDKTTKEPLFGANVILVGTSIGTSSDVNGLFKILNIPPKKYDLKASYISYNNEEFKIDLTSGKSLELNIELQNQIIDLGEVTVSAQSSGQVSAINQQLASEAIVNVVSAEKMLEFPDANVAESVARLPGVSINRDGGEGSSIVVRGLSPKYSKITVDGVDMASTGANSRGANLSGVSQENLKGIELYKSPTADMDGESIGGTVNLQTGKAPIKPVAIIRTFGFYNELEDNLNQYSLFGKYSQRFFDNSLGIQISANLESRDRSTDIFSGNYNLGATDSSGIAPLQITSSAVTDRLETRERMGGNLILDYNVGNGFIMLNSFLSQTDRNIVNRRRDISITNVRGRETIQETDLSVISSVNTLRGEHLFFGFKTDWSLSLSYSRNERPFEYQMRFDENITLPNRNEVTIEQNAIDYYNFVEIDSTAPIFETIYNYEHIQERNIIGQLNFQYDFSLSSDISGYIKFGGKLKHINRDRIFKEGQMWAYLYEEYNKLISLDFADNDYKPNDFLRGKADLGIILDPKKSKEFYEQNKNSEKFINSLFYAYRSSVSSASGIPNYQTKENVNAFYIMPKIKYGGFLTLIPGIRYEMVDNEYFGNNYFSLVSNSPQPRDSDYFLNDTTDTQNYNEFLPMIHLKIQPTEWFDIRTSFTKTISRPDYNWLIPAQSLSTFSGVNVYKGNSRLKPALAQSYDIYASFYKPELGLLSIGYFHKNIDDISVLFRTYVGSEQITNGLPDFDIEPLQNRQHGINNLYQGNFLRTPINLPRSEVNGLELEIQTNFQLLPVPNFLKGIVISFNYSWINSSTYFPFSNTKSEIVFDPAPRIVRTTTSGLREGKVPGQADRLMNIALGYDYLGFSGRISLFKQSESIESVGTQKELDDYRSGFTRLDLSVKQAVTDYLNVFVNAVNITNNEDQAFQSVSDFDTSLEDYGRSFELGLQLNF